MKMWHLLLCFFGFHRYDVIGQRGGKHKITTYYRCRHCGEHLIEDGYKV